MSSNENKSLKTIGIIIGIAVSCITIFTFITGVASLNLLRQKNEPSYESSSEQQVTSPDTNIPGFISTPELPPTPFGLYNPSGAIEPGQPIIVDDYQLYLDENSFELYTGIGGPNILVNIAVKNLSNNSKIFRYTPSSIKIKDDTGRIYDYIEGRHCDSASPYIETKAIQLQPGESIKIYSFDSGTSNWWWCKNSHPELLPWYEGDISGDANYIIVEFNGFGPFSGFEVQIPIG
jgi:hypothetical protein